MISIDDQQAFAIVFRETVDKSTDEPLYIIKVSFPDVGMFVNGIRVMRSIEYPDRPLWVRMPGFMRGNTFITHIELSKNSDLWLLIERLSRKAVADYLKKKANGDDNAI